FSTRLEASPCQEFSVSGTRSPLPTSALIASLASLHRSAPSTRAAQASASTPVEAVAAAPAAARALTTEDLRDWRSIRSPSLSHGGQWFGYLLAPNEGDAVVVLGSVNGPEELRFPVGEPGSGAGVTISEDGRHAAFLVFPDA